jgi:hypothetical protein
MRRGAVAFALVAALAAACDAGVPSPSAPTGPADPNAEFRPDLIVADPTTVAPGDLVSLTFPEETVRGVLFVLEERVGETWIHRFNLSSDGPGPEWTAEWFPLDGDVAFPDIGVLGPGPDRVPIPDTAEPGAWRICTGNAGAEFCAAIEIVAP